MRPLTTILIGGAVLLGTLAAYGKEPARVEPARFLGDKATKGDEVLVPMIALAGGSPELVAAADVARGGVVVLVDSETPEDVTGRVVRLATATTEVPLQAAFQTRIGLVSVPRSAIMRISRDRKAVT